MKTLEFFIPLRKIPSITAQEQRTGTKKDGSTYRYDPQKLKAVKALFRDHLARHTPQEPFTGPVELWVVWRYPVDAEHPPGTFKTTKPDTDNLLKAFKDAMTKVGFWKDDAQVASEWTSKRYEYIPGVAVHVSPLPEALPEEEPI